MLDVELCDGVEVVELLDEVDEVEVVGTAEDVDDVVAVVDVEVNEEGAITETEFEPKLAT